MSAFGTRSYAEGGIVRHWGNQDAIMIEETEPAVSESSGGPQHEHRTDTTPSANDEDGAFRPSGRFVRLLSETRVVILFGAFASLVASIVLLVHSALAVVKISWHSFQERDFGEEAVEALGAEFLSMTDAILLGTVLYIIALGLYQLFFEPDLPVPDWLRFRELTELKESLVEVIVVLLGVLFVGRAVSWRSGDEIIEFGLAIAAVIIALGLVLFIGHIRRGGESSE